MNHSWNAIGVLLFDWCSQLSELCKGRS